MGRSRVSRIVGTVVAVVLGAGVAAPGPATAEVPGVAPDVTLDVGLLGKAAALRHCATPAFASDPDSVRVLYGVRQVTGTTSTSRSFVLRNGAGRVLLCDLLGRDRPSSLPLPTTSTSRPAVLFSAGQRRWTCDGAALSSFLMTTWLKVEDPVRSARVRFTVDGEPGPWSTAARHGRFIHLQSLLGPAPAAAVLTVELQLLREDGSPVTVRGIPSGPRPLAGCGTTVAIG